MATAPTTPRIASAWWAAGYVAIAGAWVLLSETLLPPLAGDGLQRTLADHASHAGIIALAAWLLYRQARRTGREEPTAPSARAGQQARCLHAIADGASRIALASTVDALEMQVARLIAELGDHMQADRGYLFEFSDSDDTMRNTHEWCRPGIEPQIHRLGNIARDELPWLWPQIQSGAIVEFKDVGALQRVATVEYAHFMAQGIRSLICVPMHDVNGRVRGFLGFDFVHGHHDFSTEMMDVLSIAADLLGASHARLLAQKHLEIERQSLQDVLWGTDVGTWRWNVQTGETVVNARWGEMVGLDLKRVGETTIQLMESLTHPDDLEIARRRLEEHFRGELAVYECELRMRHADGHWVWVLDRGRVVHRDAEGRPLWMSGIHLDISRRKSAQVALEEAHESLRKFASRIPGMVYQYRQYPDGRISFPYSSDVVLDLFGLHPHEIREDGARIFAPLHPDDLPRVLALIDTCIREVAPWRDHFRVIRPDGSIRWLEGESDPELLPDGSILCHGHIRDITGRREFEHQVQMLSMAIEQSPESIVITDANGLIEFVNAAFLHSTGYEREALIGKNPRILQSGETPASTYTAMWAALSNGQCWRGELINRRKSGERYYEFAVIAPIRNADGQVTNFLAIKDDITEKKRMGEELTAYRHHLEDLVAERTRQLAEARERADAANVAKSSFLANMSHEIRTPLNAILGNSHLLGRGTLDALQRRQLDQLEKAGKHLLGVINDILDLSKIEAGRLSMELRPFSLRELVEEVAAILAPSAQAKGLRIETSLRCPEDAFIGDAVRIRQALINYISNAIKFSSQGTIRLECHATGKTDGKTNLRFAVTDTGVGIAPETLARLFQPFEQADATITRRFGGTGLGLAIVRHLVSLMGGHVGAESQPGMGSTFWFSLPLAKAAAPVEDTPAPCPHVRTPGQSYAMQRVLLVEDHPTNREVGRAILEALGLAVTTACDGREAVERVAEEAFDLVLMDMQMPVLDGLSATLEIRRLPGRESLPIVAMTANVFEEDRQACLSAGMDDFLTKPIEPDRLQATLDRWLPVDPSRPQGAAPHVARPEGDRAGTAVAALQRLGDLGHLDGIRTRVVAGGRADRHLDLLRNFLHQHVAEIDALGITGGSLPTTDVPRLAHAIKGAAANLGLVRIAEVAHRLESGAAPLATLHNACREVLEVIEAVGAEALSGPHAPLTMAPVDDATLASFRELLAASDARAIRLFHEHGAGFEQRFGNRAMGLSSLLDRFDFPGVMALLDAPEGAGDADGNQPPQPPQQTDGR